jgi:small neutral amino acid transporter SnatA (MarC family)
MKIAITLFIVVGLLLFLGQTKIEFNPFKFSIAKPYLMVGVFLLVIGISLIQQQASKDGKTELYKEIKKAIDDLQYEKFTKIKP